jgi:predicted nuclease with TOPRIM domain
MTTLTLEKPLDNELEKQTIEDMNQGSQEPASKADLRNLTVRLESKFERIESKFERIESKFERIESKFDRLDSRMIENEASLKMYINDKTDRLTTIFISFGAAQLVAIAGMFLAIFLRFS